MSVTTAILLMLLGGFLLIFPFIGSIGEKIRKVIPLLLFGGFGIFVFGLYNLYRLLFP